MKDAIRRVIGLGLIVASLSGSAGRTQRLLKPGKGSFVFLDSRLNQGRPLTVWTYIPSGYVPSSPILFVMHGNSRNADDYRNQWAEIAERNNAFLLCPEFSKKDFPRDTQYNMGNMFVMDEHDALLESVPRREWTYSLIEPIFDLARKMMQSTAPGYFIYGHSAGSQFVHRFLFFVPEARVLRAVCANAGWYTLPDFEISYPYGFKDTTAEPETLGKAFAKDVTIYLGDEDIDTESSSLRKTPEAMAQGRHRFERGHFFFENCGAAARRLGLKLNWKLAIAPGVAHSNSRMAAFAERALFK